MNNPYADRGWSFAVAVALAMPTIANAQPVAAAAVATAATGLVNNADVLAAERLFSAWADAQIAYRGLPGIVVGVVQD